MKRQPDVKEVIPLEDIYMFSPVPALEKGDFFSDRTSGGVLFIHTPRSFLNLADSLDQNGKMSFDMGSCCEVSVVAPLLPIIICKSSFRQTDIENVVC